MTNCRTIIIILHLNFVFIILKRYLEKKLHIKIKLIKLKTQLFEEL